MKTHISKFGICILFFLSQFHVSLSAESIDLFEAISWEDEIEFKKALDSGANPNQIDSNLNISILMKAIETMKPNLVEILLNKKANVNLKIPDSKKTALMFFMEKFIQNSELDNDGNTIYKDDRDMLDIYYKLLNAGANVNEMDHDGKSVLTYLMESPYAQKSETIIRELIARNIKANVNFSKDIKKPVCLCLIEDTSGKQIELIQIFFRQKICDPNQEYKQANQRKTSLLFIALSNKDYSSTKALLEAGANPNQGASDTLMQYSPIFLTPTEFELLELLLKFKANPNAIENDIHLLEHVARNVSNDEKGEKTIDLLLAYGAIITHPKLYDSYTPYNKATHAAYIVGKYKIQKYLEKKGAVTKDKLKIKP
ncbi:MAG: hypothetical protein O9301_08490 [Leptospira sp.]|nr:hypothetical protein [Leptospira sp.]